MIDTNNLMQDYNNSHQQRLARFYAKLNAK
jgi:hypothetical protein